jgi:hypothetical protein
MKEFEKHREGEKNNEYSHNKMKRKKDDLVVTKSKGHNR